MNASAPFDATPFGLAAASALGTRLSRKTRAKLTRGDAPRSGEKVWRNSYYEGQIEHRIWKPIRSGSRRDGARWTAALLKKAKEFEFATRLKRRETQPGAENGALGSIGLEVLECLYSIVDYTTGRLEPAIATIAEKIGRSYSAVHRALVRLRNAQFIGWMRRSRPIEDPEPGGQQVEQITNAYALTVPTELRPWLSSLFAPSPLPACDQDRRAADRKATEAMLAGLNLREWHNATWSGDALLGETLARLAAAVESRDASRANPRRSDRSGD